MQPRPLAASLLTQQSHKLWEQSLLDHGLAKRAIKGEIQQQAQCHVEQDLLDREWEAQPAKSQATPVIHNAGEHFAQPYVLLAQYVSVGKELAVAKEVAVTKEMIVAMLGGKPLRRVTVQRILGKCNSANSTPHVRGG